MQRIIYILMFLFFCISSYAHADWQSELEQYFDIVYTFDNLQNWRGSYYSGATYDTADMPKKLDGSSTHWQTYTNYIETPPADWIGDQGPDYTWNGTKALCINYNRTPSKDGIAKGYGPSTLGMYIGTGTPDSGYKKIHIFFMLKHHAGFFNMDSPDIFHNTGVIKFLEVESGFREIGQYGTVAEQALVCDTDQYLYGYGINFQIFNFTALNSYTDIGLKEQINTATVSGTGCYQYEHTIDNRGWQGSIFSSAYKAGEWVGMEIASDIGTTGNADGETEIWVYDEGGNQIAHEKIDGYNKMQVFDHKYNKIMIGVNRIGYSYDEDACDSDENRMYFDDFIISSSTIAPTYFALLNQVQTVKQVSIGKPMDIGGYRMQF